MDPPSFSTPHNSSLQSPPYVDSVADLQANTVNSIHQPNQPHQPAGPSIYRDDSASCQQPGPRSFFYTPEQLMTVHSGYAEQSFLSTTSNENPGTAAWQAMYERTTERMVESGAPFNMTSFCTADQCLLETKDSFSNCYDTYPSSGNSESIAATLPPDTITPYNYNNVLGEPDAWFSQPIVPTPPTPYLVSYAVTAAPTAMAATAPLSAQAWSQGAETAQDSVHCNTNNNSFSLDESQTALGKKDVVDVTSGMLPSSGGKTGGDLSNPSSQRRTTNTSSRHRGNRVHKKQMPISKGPKSKVLCNSNKIIAYTTVWELDSRPKGMKDPEEREKIRLNRQLNRDFGPCLQHRKAHQACDLRLHPYLRCFKANEPLFLADLCSIKLFRDGPCIGHPLATPRNEPYALKDIQGPVDDPIHLRLTQGLGHELEVDVTSFTPRSDDKVNHVWYLQGAEKHLPMPPYCLTSLKKTRSNMRHYIKASGGQYLDDIISSSGPVTQSVLSQAKQFCKTTGCTMVRQALQILAINRMIERDWQIVGPETLGIVPSTDANCPWVDKKPATPMMDTQLDQIIIQGYLRPLRTEVLQRLRAKLDAKKDFFAILLTVFILATNTEWLLRHSRRNAIRYNKPRRYNSVELAKAYFEGHNTLLSYFHYLTRGSSGHRSHVNGIFIPSGHSLSQDEATFLKMIQNQVAAQVEHFSHLRKNNRYEMELYWSHQLFMSDWRPVEVEVVDEVYTISRLMI